jgi:hypothetical protein
MCTWIRSGDPAHAAEVVAVEYVAGNVPTKQTWLRLGDLCRNLLEVGIRMMLGEKLVPVPRFAGARIEPKGLECVTSLAQTWDVSRTTFPGSHRDIHDLSKLSIPFADAYKLVFHVLSSVRLRRPEARQIALLGSRCLVGFGFCGDKAKGRLAPSSGDLAHLLGLIDVAGAASK